MNNRPARGDHAQSYPPDLLHRIETAHICKQQRLENRRKRKANESTKQSTKTIVIHISLDRHLS